MQNEHFKWFKYCTALNDLWCTLTPGNKDYPRVGDLGPPECPPRLFQITDATTGGTGVDVWEIFNFDQQDLDENDVMMLDTFREVCN